MQGGSDDDEKPVHTVTIPRPFAVGKYELTNAEFASVVRDSGYGTGESCWTYESKMWNKRAG